ncbi:GNAT family N-acetyltransferase [Marinicellulosiphila megalodicopiae]|uniref:GNAT family N-acetyltransferase n=1 Tax=Marinicellulosiphila megalodicopiae TaxID=2724896 RepID=UPI003BB1B804
MAEIRGANGDDLEYMYSALYKLNEMHYIAEPEYFKAPGEIADVKDLSKYISTENTFAYVVLNNEQYIGFAVGLIREVKSPISQPITIGSIEEIYLEPDYRGIGIGKELNLIIERYCKHRGATDIFTEVWGFNDAALSFYKNCGLKTHVHWLRKKL